MSGESPADDIQVLLDNNRRWAAETERNEPGFFAGLAAQQKPRYLWIGCADSRVPANVITGLRPGEVFVHRNVANVVMEADLNCMSVVDFAIRALEVRHVIVCGHYGCAGVRAAMEASTEGVVDHWLSGIRDLWRRHSAELGDLDSATAHARLCELHVRAQVQTLAHTTAIKSAWERGQALDIHGWIYGIEDGLLRDLGVRVASPADLEQLEA